MTHATPDAARAEWKCPLTSFSKPCGADTCSVWRWHERQTTDAGWFDAVRAEAERTGEKSSFAKAARVVANAPEAHGMGPRTGYCGLGGSVK